MRRVDAELVVIGGGPAGMAAAIRAWELGLKRVVLIDKEPTLGGILPQCIHPGFGIHVYGEDLTGPEMSERLAERILSTGVDVVLEASVIQFESSYDEKTVVAVSPRGVIKARAKALVYAAGARERTAFEIGIVGSRPAGVYTAGEAQALMDLYGVMPGKRVLIVGSGDVGLIMARRFALEGARVVGVVELMPYPGGLKRNVVQCLEDFNIPLMLRHVVVEVRGSRRVEEAVVARVGEDLNTIPGSEKVIKCDTVIIAAGLVPEVELLERAGVLVDPRTRGPIVNEFLETSLPGVFTAGNALLVNDLVDYAVEQGEVAGESAYHFVKGGIPPAMWRRARPGRGIRLVVPQLLSFERDVMLYMRPLRPMGKCDLTFRGARKNLVLPYARPAEMIRVKVKSGEFEERARELVIEVEEIEED